MERNKIETEISYEDTAVIQRTDKDNLNQHGCWGRNGYALKRRANGIS